jgi:hypothetical protein
VKKYERMKKQDALVEEKTIMRLTIKGKISHNV